MQQNIEVIDLSTYLLTRAITRPMLACKRLAGTPYSRNRPTVQGAERIGRCRHTMRRQLLDIARDATRPRAQVSS
jgi:hypothetical protein